MTKHLMGPTGLPKLVYEADRFEFVTDYYTTNKIKFSGKKLFYKETQKKFTVDVKIVGPNKINLTHYDLFGIFEPTYFSSEEEAIEAARKILCKYRKEYEDWVALNQSPLIIYSENLCPACGESKNVEELVMEE